MALVTSYKSREADTIESPIRTEKSLHRWVGAALSGALKPKPGLGNGEQKRFRMHIGVINTQNRFSFPFPKPRLGFSGPDSAAPTHRRSGIWATKRCTGAALGGALKPQRGLGNGEEKRFRVHIGMIGTQNRFSSRFPKPRLGVSAPPSAAPVQRLVGQIRRCSARLPT